jgi:hypothetical protein
MKKRVPRVMQAAPEEVLPVRVQEAFGELAAPAREGLLALSVGVGLGVPAELMEEEVVEVVGNNGKHDRERVAVGHGHESGEVTLGGRRVGVERPRVRSASTARKRYARRSGAYSGKRPSSVVSGARRGTCSSICPSGSVLQ